MADIAEAIMKSANHFTVSEKQKKILRITAIVVGGAVVGSLAIYGIVTLVKQKRAA